MAAGKRFIPHFGTFWFNQDVPFLPSAENSAKLRFLRTICMPDVSITEAVAGEIEVKRVVFSGIYIPCKPGKKQNNWCCNYVRSPPQLCMSVGH